MALCVQALEAARPYVVDGRRQDQSALALDLIDTALRATKGQPGLPAPRS